MTPNDYKILQQRINGLTPLEIQRDDGRSLSRIKAIIYDPRFKQLVKEGISGVDSRQEKSASDRMADIVSRGLSALEKELDSTEGNTEKVLSLVPKMVDLAKIVPPTKGKLSKLAIAILPELDDEETFNLRTAGKTSTGSDPMSPTESQKKPGGSKTPVPTPQSEPVPLLEEDSKNPQEWEEIEEEVRHAADEW